MKNRFGLKLETIVGEFCQLLYALKQFKTDSKRKESKILTNWLQTNFLDVGQAGVVFVPQWDSQIYAHKNTNIEPILFFYSYFP